MIALLISLIYVLVMYELAAFTEIYLDKHIAKQTDKDGRTKLENDLLHKRQLPLRGIIYINILVSGLLIYCKNIWWSISFSIFCIFYYWFCIDVTANLWWLKKNIFYRGTTSEIDGINNIVLIKIIGLILSIILCIFVYIK